MGEWGVALGGSCSTRVLLRVLYAYCGLECTCAQVPVINISVLLKYVSRYYRNIHYKFVWKIYIEFKVCYYCYYISGAMAKQVLFSLACTLPAPISSHLSLQTVLYGGAKCSLFLD